jgi:AraC-like DNA-binding protein/quercetin dioxygenase-like cupin family protein
MVVDLLPMIDRDLLCSSGDYIAPAAPSFTVGKRLVNLHSAKISGSSIWERPVILPHSHSTFEAVVVLQGEAEYLGEETQRLRPGHLWVHPPGVVHSWRELGESCLVFALRFTVLPVSPVELAQAWRCSPETVWQAMWMAQAIREGQPGWQEQVRGYLTALFVRIWQTLGWEMEMHPAEVPSPIIARLDAFLGGELSSPLRAAEVAASLGMSLRSLQRYIKRATGVTLVQRLANLRLARAAQLLEQTEWPLPEIRRQVGISDAAYFSRVFKERFGQTPTGYRRNLKG